MFCSSFLWSHQHEYSDWVEEHHAGLLQWTEEKNQSHECTQCIKVHFLPHGFHQPQNLLHIFRVIRRLAEASEAEAPAAVLRWLLYPSLTRLINREAELSAPHRGLKQRTDSALSQPHSIWRSLYTPEVLRPFVFLPDGQKFVIFSVVKEQTDSWYCYFSRFY